MSPLSDAQLGTLLAGQRHVAVIVTTFEGEVVFWNRGAEVLFDYPRQDALGRNVSDLIVPDASLGEHRAALRRAVDGGSVVFAADRRTKAGRSVPVVITLDVGREDHRDAQYVVATCRERPEVALEAADVVQERYAETAPEAVMLPQRQRQVLARIADGLTTREIAQRLGLSPKTVETHRSRLMRRLRARNLAELLRRALELGIVRIAPRGGGPPSSERRSRRMQ